MAGWIAPRGPGGDRVQARRPAGGSATVVMLAVFIIGSTVLSHYFGYNTRLI
jgi:hypothetical protein